MHGWRRISIERWELHSGDTVVAIIQRDVSLWRWVTGETCGVTRELRAAMLAASWVCGLEWGEPEVPQKESA